MFTLNVPHAVPMLLERLTATSERAMLDTILWFKLLLLRLLPSYLAVPDGVEPATATGPSLR